VGLLIRLEPEWNNLPANLHWRLREVLERCLKKDAMDRYHDISDVKADIERVLTDPNGVLVQPQALAEPQSKGRLVLPCVAALILTAIIAGFAAWNLKQILPQEPRQVVRFTYELPEGQPSLLFSTRNPPANLFNLY
jgi:hypothetical protein